MATVYPSAWEEATRDLVRRGIEEGDWSAYEVHLRASALSYARVGLTFEGWYVLTVCIADVLTPHMIAAYGGEPHHLSEALCGYTRDTTVLHGVLEAGVAFLQKPLTARCAREEGPRRAGRREANQLEALAERVLDTRRCSAAEREPAADTFAVLEVVRAEACRHVLFLRRNDHPSDQQNGDDDGHERPELGVHQRDSDVEHDLSLIHI